MDKNTKYTPDDAMEGMDEVSVVNGQIDEVDLVIQKSSDDPSCQQTAEEALRIELAMSKDVHLRLMAEYDNYRKRTLKEKTDLIKNGAERALRDLLPVVDDFDLALAHLDASDDVVAMKEGFRLIYKKLADYLLSMGVRPIDPTGQAFDDTVSEAIALVPTPQPDQQGMVIDCTSRGYMLNDKVLRFAKVVVAQ